MCDCVVIGIGNTIKSDDGVGVHVARALKGMVPEGVEVVEGSVYCADMLTLLENRRKAVFIDGIDAGDEPGAIFRFTPEQVGERKAGISMSVHDFGIYELITSARLLEQCPETVVIYAVQVRDVENGFDLSDEVATAVPRVVELVLEETRSSGPS